MHVTNEYKIYHFLFYLHFNSQHPINFFINMGNMTKGLHNNETCHEKLIVQSNGLQDNTKIHSFKNQFIPFFVSTWTWYL
jgi:hypothetical protein